MNTIPEMDRETALITGKNLFFDYLKRNQIQDPVLDASDKQQYDLIAILSEFECSMGQVGI